MMKLLSRDALRRLLTDIARSELGAEQAVERRMSALDSIDRLRLAGRVNSFFRLYDIGTEDNLLRMSSIEGWMDVVEHSFTARPPAFAFRTSGSTDTPHEITHTSVVLAQEIEELSALFAHTGRIVSTVSSLHIYGFLWTALLPDALRVPFIDPRGFSAHQWSTELTAGDLVVSFPEFLHYLGESVQRFPAAEAVSSTAPLSASTSRQLVNRGLSRVWEIYGSTETAGVGYRTSPDEPFSLMRFWRRKEGDTGTTIVRTRPQDREHPGELAADEVSLPDNINWCGERTFLPAGRLDGAVQAGGVNVYPMKIAAAIRTIAGVRDAYVRKMRSEEGDRLKALVIPDKPESQKGHLTAERISEWIAANLPAAERPVSVRLVDEFPKNEMGKPDDWDIAVGPSGSIV